MLSERPEHLERPKAAEVWFPPQAEASAPGIKARSVYVTSKWPVQIHLEHDEAGDLHIRVMSA